MDDSFLQASEVEMQRLQNQNIMLQTQSKLQELLNKSYSKIIPVSAYNSQYSYNNYGCGYNPINYQMQMYNPINSGFIDKEATVENKEVEEMKFDYNKEFVYQSEWNKYGYDLDEYNSISDEYKRLFEDCIDKVDKFDEIYYTTTSMAIYIKYDDIHYFGNITDNYIKYKFLRKDFNDGLKTSIINKNLELLNEKFQAYKSYKQNKQFIDKYYDKVVPDNVQTNYDYIEELIKENEE